MMWWIILLQFADIATTYYLVEQKGLKEGNPLLDKAMQKLGFWPAILAFKGSFIGLVLVLPMETWLAIAIILLYLGVVGNNLLRVFKNK